MRTFTSDSEPSSNGTRRKRRTWLSVLGSKILWLGILLIGLFWLASYFFMDRVALPYYTRQSDIVTVPDVREASFEDAQEQLVALGLGVEPVAQRQDESLPPDQVLKQDPAPLARVKPGRTVFVTVNNGAVPKLLVPDLISVSLREAQSQLAANRLKVGAVRQDTTTSRYRNIITRQRPAPGDSVIEGSSVTLWVSRGRGARFVTVPDITGRDIKTAERALRGLKLRLVILADDNVAPEDMNKVMRQIPDPGIAVPSGSDVQGFAKIGEGYYDDAPADSTSTEGP